MIIEYMMHMDGSPPSCNTINIVLLKLDSVALLVIPAVANLRSTIFRAGNLIFIFFIGNEKRELKSKRNIDYVRGCLQIMSATNWGVLTTPPPHSPPSPP